MSLISSLRIIKNLFIGFETIPKEHKQLFDNFICHPEDIFKIENSIFLEIILAEDPAERTNFDPEKGKFSIEDIESKRFVLNNV